MRRKDRQVLELDRILDIMYRCDTARIALVDEGKPYIVPLNFGYEVEDKTLCLYFHCAQAGRKLDIIRKNPSACFEMDCSHKLITGSLACDCSMEYESVIGDGTIEILTDSDCIIKGLDCIMKHYSDKRNFKYDEKYLNAVSVLKLTANSFTAKRLMK